MAFNDYTQLTLIDLIDNNENDAILDYILRFEIGVNKNDKPELRERNLEKYIELSLQNFQEDYANLGAKISRMESIALLSDGNKNNTELYKDQEQYQCMTKIVREVLDNIDLKL